VKPPPFEYRAARSVDEAVELLHSLGDEAKIIAGGQSLIPMMNFRLAQPGILIDVNGLDELDFVRAEAAELVVGARTRTHRLETSPEVREAAPLLAEAAALVGHPAIRHRGTIGGSLVHGDSAAELPTAAVTLDARITLRSVRATREVPASEFFLGPFMTAAEQDELLTRTFAG
jgi:carbon-monoxide dehydrogenase medium subunit